jgi:DNA helicase-2/ATP-dependent DNA helicase PcrA
MKSNAEPVILRGFDDAEAEANGIVDCLWQYARLGGIDPWQSAAVLVRTNIQSELIVDALVKNNIPVRTSRPSKELTSAIADASQSTNRNELATWVTDVLTESESEVQRWVAEQVQVFLKLDHPGSVDGRTFTSWMRATSADQLNTDGVEVLTFHSAKGREWDCVVVAGAEVGLMPHNSAISKDQKDEEVRLAYVALTRASQQLFITWCETRKNRTAGRSSLLADISSEPVTESAPTNLKRTKPKQTPVVSLEDELRTWRSSRARVIKQAVETVCSDYELRLITKQLPKTTEELATIVGQITAKRIAPDVLAIVARADF